jgi:hypothetical protein
MLVTRKVEKGHYRPMYLLPLTFITNEHKLSVLKQNMFIISNYYR